MSGRRRGLPAAEMRGVLTVVERRGRHPAGAFDLGGMPDSAERGLRSIFMVPVSSVRTGADPGIVGRDAVAANRESGDSLIRTARGLPEIDRSVSYGGTSRFTCSTPRRV